MGEMYNTLFHILITLQLLLPMLYNVSTAKQLESTSSLIENYFSMTTGSLNEKCF